jgi:hypothetical protein
MAWTMCTIPDRRLPFAAVLGESVACVLAFPVAALLVSPAVLDGEATQAALPLLPIALLLLNALLILLDPPEPGVWNVSRAIGAGVWRATLLFIGLLWTLVLTGQGGAVPVGVFIVAWGCLVAASAILRTLRLLGARRIPV